MQGAAAVQAEKGKGTTGVTTGARKTAVTAPIRVISYSAYTHLPELRLVWAIPGVA